MLGAARDGIVGAPSARWRPRLFQTIAGEPPNGGGENTIVPTARGSARLVEASGSPIHAYSTKRDVERELGVVITAATGSLERKAISRVSGSPLVEFTSSTSSTR